MWRWIIRGPTTPPNTVKHHLNKHRQTSKSRVPSASNVRARCSFSISCRCSCAKVVAETCRASQKRFPTHGDGNCTQKPQIRSCLVFKPSILGSNILNGIPGENSDVSKKREPFWKEISSCNHLRSGDYVSFQVIWGDKVHHVYPAWTSASFFLSSSTWEKNHTKNSRILRWELNVESQGW